MEPATLTLVQSAVQVLTAALYLWVAKIVLERPVEHGARLANALFGVWWVSLAVVFVLIPLSSVPARVLGYRNLALSVTLLNAMLILIVAAVWGLVYYLAYLYTGSHRIFWPITAFYIALAVVLIVLIAWMRPIGFSETGTLAYENDALQGTPAVILGLFFSGPVVLAALAYGSLLFRVKEAALRYRIGMVAGAFLVQFGWSLASSALELGRRFPESTALTFVSSAIGLLAGVAILLAFRPPRPIRDRLGALSGGT